MYQSFISRLILGAFVFSIMLLVIVLTQVKMDGTTNSTELQVVNGELDQKLPTTPVQFGFLPGLSPSEKTSSASGTCTLLSNSMRLSGTPQQIEGPYFVDQMPNRSDIRTDTSDGSIKDGIPLRLIIHVYDVDNGQCVPLSGTKVDIWHTDSQGIYSGVNQMGTSGKNFLRGYQVTDSNGTVQFSTIYPGWYEGRTIHIHDKVRMFNGSKTTLEWTSQLYFNNSMNQLIHKQSPYSNHGPPQTANEQDVVYRSGSVDGLVDRNSGEHLTMNLTKHGSGYLGETNIVLKTR